MKRYTMVKSKGKLKRVEVQEDGKEMILNENELPPQANWRAIEKARKRVSKVR